MSHHEGVSCDTCLRTNFRGKRYKCLVCFDYDLCAVCRDSGATSGRHRPEHPMQCILTRNDLDLFYSGETLATEQPLAFTCPFCGKLGFTDSTLYEHVTDKHTDSTNEVVCPICASLPGGEPNQVTNDFLNHIRTEHHTNRSESVEPQIVRLRSRHVRGLNGNRNRRLENGIGRASAGGVVPSSTSASSASSGQSATSSRDLDPLTQLLSQLSDVRRYNAPNRSDGRIPLDRILRRHANSSSSPNSITSTAHESNANHSTANSTATAAHYRMLADLTSSPLHLKSSSASASSSASTLDHKFLLAGLTSPPLSEAEQEILKTIKADRSIFVQELVVGTLDASLDFARLTAAEEVKTSQEVATGSSVDDKNETIETSNVKLLNETDSGSTASEGEKETPTDEGPETAKCKQQEPQQSKQHPAPSHVESLTTMIVEQQQSHPSKQRLSNTANSIPLKHYFSLESGNPMRNGNTDKLSASSYLKTQAALKRNAKPRPTVVGSGGLSFCSPNDPVGAARRKPCKPTPAVVSAADPPPN